ncbi:hypothetical protein KFK09_023679 [Dendrobium nobile]|uniref:C2H2-type domain-containing protein n=1 Tax=Dendrobium nobile TaxID=94219 RepID=A0A8T3ABM2_DENNO|nr:hypothetical protein KFK09_023679 [Dendrobium nobile]
MEKREPWRYRGSFLDGRDHPLCGSFSWPPRSYSCSFCRREFRSAQALGGHMNVHRRDRAKLRLSTPWDSSPSPSNPNPNNVPNLNITPPTFLSPPADMKKSTVGVKLLHGVEQEDLDEEMVTKNKTSIVRRSLDLGTSCGDLDDNLDLELRLG